MNLKSCLKSKKDDRFSCPVCKKKMVWYVGTLLCLDCDWEVVSMLRFEHDYKKMIGK